MEWDDTPAGRSGGRVCALDIADWLWDCPASEGRLGVCSHATRLPVPAAVAPPPAVGARSLSAAGQSPAALAQDPASERTRCSRAPGLRRAGQLVSSNLTVAETAPFVQRNLQAIHL